MHNSRFPTLRTSINTLVFLIITASIIIGFIAHQLYGHGLQAQTVKTTEVVEKICQETQSQYHRSVPDKELKIDLASTILELLLSLASGVEGGIWSEQGGFVAYAFPTYDGGHKKDTPQAEQAHIIQFAQEALSLKQKVSYQRIGERDLLIFSACPLTDHESIWVMTRLDVRATYVAERYAMALGGFALVIFIIGIWHIFMLLRWSRLLDSMATSIAKSLPSGGQIIASSGYRDLDQIVNAFNTFNTQIKSALEHSMNLERKLQHAERSALIGRMVAGLAHEIRNPLGAIRLKAENALAGDIERRTIALTFILKQITRLEELLARLLSLVRAIKPEIQKIDISVWLNEVISLHLEKAHSSGKALKFQSMTEYWYFDPVLMTEVLDNLIQNALQHTRHGDSVQILCTRKSNILSIQITDTGTGIPMELRHHLFEPFVSARHGGIGLGLAHAHDIVSAHGGTLRLLDQATSTTFEIELPWQES